MQSNLADTYQAIGRFEENLSLRRSVYSGRLKLNGEEHGETIRAAGNYANGFFHLQRFEEAKSLMRKTMPVARRVLGESNVLTLMIRSLYTGWLYKDDATLDDLREAVTTLEDIEPTARRVLGVSHPTTSLIAGRLRAARAALSARETQQPGNA